MQHSPQEGKGQASHTAVRLVIGLKVPEEPGPSPQAVGWTLGQVGLGSGLARLPV
jgi:hypothetical protein